MVEAVCDCGAVRLEIARDPVELNDCQCSWCQRTGALWAYYQTDEVRFLCEPDATYTYQRGPKRLDFHFCRTCGLLTHWSHRDRAKRRMGVNASLMPREVREGARVIQGW